MRARLSVPESMRESLAAFVNTHEIPLDVVCTDDCSVAVVESAEGQQSTPSVLHAGGWITCSTARGVAATLDIGSRSMGTLLDHLKIRIRECALGCFD